MRLNVGLTIPTLLQPNSGVFSCKAAVLQVAKWNFLDNVQNSRLNFPLFSAMETEVKLNIWWPQTSQDISRSSPLLTEGQNHCVTMPKNIGNFFSAHNGGGDDT